MTLAKRPEVRKRQVYIRRKASGPPPPATVEAELVDDLVREAAIDFDLSPILAGDLLFAQKVADDFVADVRKRASAVSGLTNADLDARLTVLWPYLYRSLNTFRDRLRTAIGGQT